MLEGTLKGISLFSKGSTKTRCRCSREPGEKKIWKKKKEQSVVLKVTDRSWRTRLGQKGVKDDFSKT